jgi:hypothetical protein
MENSFQSIPTIRKKLTLKTNEKSFEYLLILSKKYDRLLISPHANNIFGENIAKLNKVLNWIDNKIGFLERKIGNDKAEEIDRKIGI